MNKETQKPKESASKRKKVKSFDAKDTVISKSGRVLTGPMGLKSYDTCGINPELNPCGDANEY